MVETTRTRLSDQAVRELTEQYYSCFLCTDISTLAPGVHFVCSPLRDEEVRGFGCRYSVYILVTGETAVVAYAPGYEGLIGRFKGKRIDEIIAGISAEYRLHELKLFIFDKEKVTDFGNARLLTEADYPLFERFFRATNPDADPEGWLEAYFTEKSAAGLFTGCVVDGRLVCCCDAPDMPYMEGLIQHTGIMTLPDERVKGYARAAAALSAHNLIESGICPQWECDAENAASAATAKSVGHREFGTAYILETSDSK